MAQLEKALTYLERHQKEMMGLWETVVRLETPSGDTAASTSVTRAMQTATNFRRSFLITAAPPPCRKLCGKRGKTGGKGGKRQEAVSSRQ